MSAAKHAKTSLAVIILASTACCVWFANAQPNGQRYWDETHAMRNVRSILRSGSLRPSFAFYPGLAHLPQTGLLALSQHVYQITGWRPFRILEPNGHFTATAFLLGRWLSLAYGIAALLLVYRIGRAEFSTSVGVLASGVLALSPWFLHVSTIFKPDSLLMLTTLAAFYFAVQAARRNALEPYLLAGLAIGLSASSKQNGALSSIPLISATALGQREVRRWLWLAAAGIVSIFVFLSLNPWPALLPQYLAMGRNYAQWASSQPTAPVSLPVFAAGVVFRRDWHGAVFGSLAWAGLIGLAVESLRGRRFWPERAASTLLVIFVCTLPLACALVSSHPKPNILIPLLPFTALAAAWALIGAWRLVAERLAPPSRRLILGLACPALFAAAALPYASSLYQGAVPESTESAAVDWIRRDARFLAHRTIVSDGIELGSGYRRFQPNSPVPLELSDQRLAARSSNVLDLADYEVFAQAELAGADGAFYSARMSRSTGQRVLTVEPHALRRRGRALVILAHPWRVYRGGKQATVSAVRPVAWRRGGRRTLAAALAPRFKPGQVISLDLTLTEQQAESCALVFDGQVTPLHRYRKSNSRSLYMTARRILEKEATRIRFECRKAELVEIPPTVTAIRWLPYRPTGG